MPRPGPRCALLALLVFGSPLDVASAQPTRAGTEFRANTYTPNAQSLPAVAMASDGDFIVVWQSNTQDGNGYGVFGQRYSSAGVAQSAEFRANGFTNAVQSVPVVGMDGAGGFVVAWAGGGDQDGSSSGIFARRFNSSGTAQAFEFQINAYTVDPQTNPAISMNSTGDFVVAWASNGQDTSSYGVFARRFNSSGAALGLDLQVNAYIAGPQSAPSIGIDANRNFVVVWRSYGQDGGQNGIFARRFNSGGASLGGEFQVTTLTINNQRYPAVAMASAGSFIVAWESQGQDGAGYAVIARRFSSAGTALSGELLANTLTSNGQSLPEVALGANGSFMISWQDAQHDGNSFGVFARLFDSAGAGQGPEAQVNTYVTNSQNASAVAGDGTGRFVVAWESYQQDGAFGDGVFAQRFAKALAVLDIDGDGAVDPLNDSILVLRYTFGFRGATLIDGAVHEGACTRCDAPAIEAYLAGLV